MLYLGIDQHRKQLSVSVRNEAGDVVLRRQVSTEWSRIRAFFDGLRQPAEPDGGFVAILGDSGFRRILVFNGSAKKPASRGRLVLPIFSTLPNRTVQSGCPVERVVSESSCAGEKISVQDPLS
jgi:hypothetical protein